MSTCRCSIEIILNFCKESFFDGINLIICQMVLLSVPVTFLNNIFTVSYRSIAKSSQRSKFHEKVSVRDRIECQSHSEKSN